MKIKRPMLIGATLCVICVIAVFYCKTAIFAAILFVCLALALNMFKFRNKKFTLLILVIAVILTSLALSLLKIETAQNLSGERVSESFVITSSPYYTGGNFSADATCLSNNTLKKGDKIRLYYDKADLEVGDVFSGSLKLSHLEDNRYKSSYYSEGIYIVGYITQIERLSDDSSVLCLLPKLRRSIKEVLNNAPISYEAKSISSAVTIGNRNEFTESFKADIKSAGVSHVFVISGMHLVILMGSVLKFLSSKVYKKQIYALVAFSGVFLIAFICGFTMSIIRAAIMYVLFAAAPLFERDNDPLNSLASTVCLISAVSPYAIFSIAFQLSMAATFGIVVLTDFIGQKICLVLRIKNIILSKIVAVASVTISATVMTAPIAVYHFGLLSTVGIITNLLITYAVTHLLILSAIGIVAGLILPSAIVSSAPLYVSGVLSEYSVAIIKYFANLPFSAVPLSRWTTVIFVLIAALLVVYRYTDRKYKYVIGRRV